MQQNDLIAPGSVWLVGAGPGDPDLLTRKAERLLLAADVVFHDALVGPAILALVRDDCEVISVGKRSGRHSKDQETINDLIVAVAKSGKRVVRLKGGDPSIFGRAAEEIAHCHRHGIEVRICPGITAASAAAASGLVSLTLRGTARSLTFVTAHLRAGCGDELDWIADTCPTSTLAIYMGRAAAPEITRRLVAAGRNPDTPVMVAVNLSLPDERLIRGTLGALPFLTAMISDDDPTLLLVGEAVARATDRAAEVAKVDPRPNPESARRRD